MTKDFALRQQAFDERGPQQAVIQDIAYMFAVIACTCTMSDIPQHWKIILHPSITENDQKRDRAPLGPLGLSTLQAIKTVLIMVNDGAWYAKQAPLSFLRRTSLFQMLQGTVP